MTIEHDDEKYHLITELNPIKDGLILGPIIAMNTLKFFNEDLLKDKSSAHSQNNFNFNSCILILLQL